MTTSKRNRDWSHELAKFESSKNKTRTIQLSSPGVAQVTKNRLGHNFDTAITIRTAGANLIFEK